MTFSQIIITAIKTTIILLFVVGFIYWAIDDLEKVNIRDKCQGGELVITDSLINENIYVRKLVRSMEKDTTQKNNDHSDRELELILDGFLFGWF